MKKLLLITIFFSALFVSCSDYDFEDFISMKGDRYIWYTSSDGEVVAVRDYAFGVELISHHYGYLLFADVVTRIGRDAFPTVTKTTTDGTEQTETVYNCLKTIDIPSSVTTIEILAFEECYDLEKVVIGDGVKSIGYKAFYNCRSLKKVYCRAKTPPTPKLYEGWDAFPKRNDFKIYVPKESLAAYKSAQYWSDYDYAIVGYDYSIE